MNMFFSSKTIEALKEDHKKLKDEIVILKDSERSIKEKRNAFDRLVPRLVSHSKREEKAIYSFMKAIGGELKLMALEGEQEHKIVDELVENMASNSLPQQEWIAMGKVLSELLDHHISEEEKDGFPLLKKYLDTETDFELYKKYALREEEYEPKKNVYWSQL